MNITWKLLKELAETHGLTMSNPSPSLYNVNRGEGNMLFNGSAKECYAFLRGYGEAKPPTVRFVEPTVVKSMNPWNPEEASHDQG